MPILGTIDLDGGLHQLAQRSPEIRLITAENEGSMRFGASSGFVYRVFLNLAAEGLVQQGFF